MADEVNIGEKAADDRVQQAIDQLVSQMPDEINLVDEDGKPFEDSTDDDIIVLADETKFNLALLMLATGEDFETTVNNTLKHAVDSYAETLDNDEEE